MSNDKQKTGVDLFYDELVEATPFSIIDIDALYKKAKKMRENEYFEVFKAGQESMDEGGKGFEQYYNETF